MSGLQNYIPFVNFLGQAMGPNCEVVLHDLTDPDHAIIATANGHVSGRKIGGPTTDLVLKILKEGLEGGNAFIANYNARSKNNHICRSSSFFIRDEGGKIVGVLCVNVDINNFVEAKRLLDGLINCEVQPHTPAKTTADVIEVFENLHSSIDDVLTAIIDNVLNKHEVTPDRMSLDEKIDVVKRLNENGLFLLKGGLSELAKRMKLSEPTIYRYLNKIKEY
jgi:predicted transcriptional regulator YheO